MDPALDQSVAVDLAGRLVRIRLRLVPPHSRREKFYFRWIRPLLVRMLRLKGNGAPPDASSPPALMVLPRALPSHDDIKRILVVKCDHVGDFFLSLQAFHILRSGFPKAHITLLCAPWNRDLAVTTGLFDDVCCATVFNRKSSNLTNQVDTSQISALSLPEFDLSIDLRADLGTLFIQTLVKSRFRAGFAYPQYIPEHTGCGPQHPPLDYALPVPPPRVGGHQNNARQAQTLLATLASGIVHFFHAEAQSQQALAPLLATQSPIMPEKKGKGPLIGLNTRSGAPTKDWPLASFVEMSRILINDLDATIVLFGTDYEKVDGKAFEDALPENRLHNLMGAIPLTALPSALQALDLYVGLDSGASHIASLSGKSVLCLHPGISYLETFAPVGPRTRLLKTFNLSCAPCGLTELKACLNNHLCMTFITPARAADEAKAMLRPLPETLANASTGE